jgi:Zn finger protein HypA/HybF involved in hydrogenase expression
VDDLKESEIKAYRAKSSEVGQTMIQKLPASIKNLPYKCPQCHQSSAAIAFIKHFLEAECPKCHQHFKPTPLGFVLNS